MSYWQDLLRSVRKKYKQTITTMNQKQLEIFIEVADCLNFTKAAERLFLSQTTVTLQIKKLEETLGVKLFNRNSKSVSLTPAGKVFYEGARVVLIQMKQLMQNTREGDKGYTGIVNIGFVANISATGVSEVINEFSEKYPEVLLQFTGGYPGEIYEQLKNGKYDIVMIPSVGLSEDKNLDWINIGIYSLVGAFHSSHRFAEKRILDYSDFSGEKFLQIGTEQDELRFTKHFARMAKQHGVDLNVILHTDNVESVFLMVDSNLGVTVLPEYFTVRLENEYNILTRPVAGEENCVEIRAIWKKHYSNPALKLFIEELKNKYDL